MPLPDEELFTIKDVANLWKKSEQYVLTKLRLRKFQRVIIERRLRSGLRWTAHYYFDKALWPFKPDEGNVVEDKNGVDMFYLLDLVVGSEKWMEDAETIFIPLRAIEVFQQDPNFQIDSSNVSPLDLNKLDASKMSENLRIAIAADTYLYSGNHIRTERGDRVQIDDWIKKHYPRLTTNARRAITDVVNRRRGGPPSIESRTPGDDD